MKKSFISVVLLLVLCFLTACSQKQEPETDTAKTPAEIMEAIISSQTELPELIHVSAGDAEFDTYLSNYYLLEQEQISDGVLCYANGVEASEIAVLVLENESNVKSAAEILSAYPPNRAGDFEGYAPQQAALAKNGTVVTSGKYMALLMCSDTPAAKNAFLNCFGESVLPEELSATPVFTVPDRTESVEPEDDIAPPETNDVAAEPEKHESNDSVEPETDNILIQDTSSAPIQNPVPETKPEPVSPAPEIETPAETSKTETAAVPTQPEEPPVQVDTSYNSAAILRAWSSGDTSSLGETNLSIYNAAKDVIDQNITAGMSSYEKELAVHDWITGWSSFSMSAFSHAPGSGAEQDVDTPYGVLINRSGTCWGYSSTFQLFMDMLDIECITVYGTPNSSGVEHTWNQVCLDGEWYCVDTAWDDPIGGSPGHIYFNLTSEEFRHSGIHRWDETSVPEAAGTKYRYGV